MKLTSVQSTGRTFIIIEFDTVAKINKEACGNKRRL